MDNLHVDLAESNLRVAERGFAMWGGLEWTEKILRARTALDVARAERRDNERAACMVFVSAIEEYVDDVIHRPFLLQARQSHAHFLAREASAYPDGWSWPVIAMEAGWSHGALEGRQERQHYYPVEVLSQVAEAMNGARFRRRHPTVDEGDGFQLSELTIGWVSDSRVEGSTVRATVHLLHTEKDISAKLMAAQEDKKMDLFGVSIMGYFAWEVREIEGVRAAVATKLVKFVGLDMCAEPGCPSARFLNKEN
jgi:hypothetical protein